MRTLFSLLSISMFAGCQTLHSVGPEMRDDGRLASSELRMADVGQFPNQVSVQTWNGAHICSGVVLAGDAVLTSAHCIEQFGASDLRVEAGAVELQAGGQIAVSDVVMHPDYERGGQANDLAVLWLESSVGVEPVTLGEVSLVDQAASDQQLASFSGWGNGSDRLRFVELPVLTDDVCEQAWGALASDIGCAGAVRSSVPCEADDGGPVGVDVDGRSVVVGIANATGTCEGETSAPQTFTALGAQRDWLDAVVGDLGWATAERADVPDSIDTYAFGVELGAGLGARMEVVYQAGKSSFWCTDMSFDEGGAFGRVPEQTREVIEPDCWANGDRLECAFSFPDQLGDSCESTVRHMYLVPSNRAGTTEPWASLSFVLDRDMSRSEVQEVACTENNGTTMCGNDLLYHDAWGEASVRLVPAE